MMYCLRTHKFLTASILIIILFAYLYNLHKQRNKLDNEFDSPFSKTLIISSIYVSITYTIFLFILLLFLKKDTKFFESNGLLSYVKGIRFLSAFIALWLLLIITTIVFSWNLLNPLCFYWLLNVFSSFLLGLWIYVGKRKHDAQPITTKVERSTQDQESTELESQTNKKNNKLSDSERIKKLEANQFYLMQKWVLELELADEVTIRRIRKEMRARCAFKYFGLSVAEREHLVEMAKEDSTREMSNTRRGSVQSNRMYSLTPTTFNPHNRKSHSHNNLMRFNNEPSPLLKNYYNGSFDHGLHIKLPSVERIDELPSP